MRESGLGTAGKFGDDEDISRGTASDSSAQLVAAASEVVTAEDASRHDRSVVAPGSPEALSAWWDNFARAVEDPKISTYEFLKRSILKNLDLDDSRDMGDFMTKAQQKALKKILALSDPQELSDVIKKLEQNRILFDLKTRAGIKCARVLLDTYISARAEYERDMKLCAAKGKRPPTETEKREEIKKIVEEKLGEEAVVENLEAVAEALTGKHREEISRTVEEAARQLRGKNDLAKIAADVTGISKKYLTLDNIVNIGVHALPLITWQHRWALAAVFGVYVTRMAVYHGYKAIEAGLVKRDRGAAGEQGHKALTALKAAGGNILSVGLSPLAAKLPAQFALWSVFAIGVAYNKSIEFAQEMLRKVKNTAKGGAEEGGKFSLGRCWCNVRKFFKEHVDTIIALTAHSAKTQAPGELTETFEKAAGKVEASKMVRLAAGVWNVGAAAGRRVGSELKKIFAAATAQEMGAAAPGPVVAGTILPQPAVSLRWELRPGYDGLGTRLEPVWKAAGAGTSYALPASGGVAAVALPSAPVAV